MTTRLVERINPYAALTLIWYAHHKKALSHVHALVVDSDKKEEQSELDPMPWTALQTVSVVPAVYGTIATILRVTGKSQYASAWWAQMVKELEPHGLFARTIYLTSLLYFTFGGLGLALDFLKWPAFLYEKKIQKNAKIDYKKALPKLFATLWWNIFSLTTLSLLAKVVAPQTGENLERAITDKVVSKFVRFTADVPSMWEMTRDTAAFLAVYDVLFFYSHWALHTKWMYANIHIKHHEWRSPTALSAAYAHPVEHIISNLGPAVVAAALFKPHVLSLAAFTSLGIFITLNEHSGYEFVDTGAFHNLHHFFVTKNFGLSGSLDEVHGTRLRPLSTRPVRGAHEP